ncbi:KRBBA protein, partial [Rhinopomastus cyanomelas]|nr:KRBBA protein [Rhinopomastus cyanomelas]
PELRQGGDARPNLPPQDLLSSLDQRANRYFWIGLWVPSAEEGWRWLNGSRLEPSRFQLSTGGGGRSCGVLRQGGIDSESCGSRLEWICQRAAARL